MEEAIKEEAIMEEVYKGTKEEFIEEADKETWEESKNKISKEASGEQPGKENAKNSIDYGISGIPLCILLLLCFAFFLFPEHSNQILSSIRGFLGREFSVYYLGIGLFIFLLSFYIAFSPLGNIVLGEPDEKPKYSFFTWGSMMFTAGLAADILFYSFGEWILYANDPYVQSLGKLSDWSSIYTLFHWGPIPWGFYLVLAAAFGFMLHVRKRSRQKYSEACRASLGKHTDGLAGRGIDLLAVFALLAGTATTFSVATPLMSEIIKKLLPNGLSTRELTLIILIATCVVYTFAVLKGMDGVSFLAKLCTWLFYALLLYIFFGSGVGSFIVKNGMNALGKMVEHFFSMATYTDPLGENHFPENWTIFYWAYWMVWCVAAPFFIGSISRGRTIRQTIMGGYIFGIGSTYVSFIVLGNFTLSLEVFHKLPVLQLYQENGSLYLTVVKMLETLPLPGLVFILLLLTMIAFYATSFDSIALVAAQYSYKSLPEGQEPSRKVQGFWAILLILLPLALVFSESSMVNLQSVSIIAAFPIGLVILLISLSFLKDAKAYLLELEERSKGEKREIDKGVRKE